MTLETIDIQEKPLITFALFAYNQERFIREAVEGALSQTYSPLEIILSDDCSPDGTYDVMQKMAAEYKGPHKILLNHNGTNLGIGSHINRVMELSHGELIVAASGDDISLPHRTLEIYKAWIVSDKKAFSIGSRYEMIDESGNSIKSPPLRDLPQEQQLLYFSKTLINYVYGCTHAWHRKVFNFFGQLPNITCEDIIIPSRSMLLGKVVSIDKALVKYRTHENNLCTSSKIYTDKEAIDKILYSLNDWVTISDDVVRCINEYKCTVKVYSRVRELDEYISNIGTSREKCIFKINALYSYPVIRLYHLLKYGLKYGFQRSDLYWIVCVTSKTAARLSLYCKRMIVKGLKAKSTS